MSSLVPVPPVPAVGIGRGTSVDATGPMTGWVTLVSTYEGIGAAIGLPLPSSGAIR